MLKFIVVAIGAIGVLAGLVLVIGSRLPVSHVATRSVVVPASQEEVFHLIADVKNAPTWRKDLKTTESVAAAPNGRERYRETTGMGTMTMEVVESLLGRRRVLKIVDEGQGFGGSWAFAIEAAPQGSRLTISEHGEVYSPLFRFVSKYIFGHTRTLETYLGHVRDRLGGSGAIEDAPAVPLTIG